MNAIEIMFLGSFFVLLVCVSLMTIVYILYLRYKRKYHNCHVWKVLWKLKHEEESPSKTHVERCFNIIIEGTEKGKISKLEIEEIKEYFFDILDTKMAHSINPVMNLENAEMPSFLDLFPEDYIHFPFGEIDKMENLFDLIEEFKDIVKLIKLHNPKISKFETKLSHLIVQILNRTKRHLDLKGEYDTEKQMKRYNQFIRTVMKVDLVDYKILTPLLSELERGRNQVVVESKRKYA